MGLMRQGGDPIKTTNTLITITNVISVIKRLGNKDGPPTLARLSQPTNTYIETWEKFTNGQLSADMVLVLKITINIYKSNLNSFQDSKLLIFVRKKRWVRI